MNKIYYTLTLLTMWLVIGQSQSKLTGYRDYSYIEDIRRKIHVGEVKAYMKPQIERCENFYEFTCGNFPNIHHATMDRKKTSRLEESKELFISKSAVMLKNLQNHQVESLVDDGYGERMMKTFYTSCHRRDVIRQTGISALLQFAGIESGWPRAQDATRGEDEDQNYDWLQIVGDLRRKLGLNVLFAMEFKPDLEDANDDGQMYSIEIGAPQFDLGSKEMYLSAEHEAKRTEYKEKIIRKLRSFLTNITYDLTNELADQVLLLEQQLVRGLKESQAQDSSDEEMSKTLKQFKPAYGNHMEKEIYIFEPYLINLIEVLQATPQRNLTTYIVWNILKNFDIPAAMEWDQLDRWCARKTMEYFPYLLENMFYHYYNVVELIDNLEMTWQDLRDVFQKDVLNSSSFDWIANDMREKMSERLMNMNLNILTRENMMYPVKKRLLNLAELHEDQYLENLLKLRKWQTQQDIYKYVDNPKYDYSQYMEIPEYKFQYLPKYNHFTNRIDIPTSFLHRSFFWEKSYPHSVRYGTLGYLLAQQMVEAFICTEANDVNVDHSWKDIISEREFHRRTQCFADVFKNSNLLRGYNAIDNLPADHYIKSVVDYAAMSIAYRTYINWLMDIDNKERDITLIGITPKQLFFITFAQLWCSDYHESFVNQSELPEKLRLNVILANFQPFSRTFYCSDRSKMNPAKKCTLP